VETTLPHPPTTLPHPPTTPSPTTPPPPTPPHTDKTRKWKAARVGDVLLRLLAAHLSQCGVDVWDLGMAPAPEEGEEVPLVLLVLCTLLVLLVLLVLCTLLVLLVLLVLYHTRAPICTHTPAPICIHTPTVPIPLYCTHITLSSYPPERIGYVHYLSYSYYSVLIPSERHGIQNGWTWRVSSQEDRMACTATPVPGHDRSGLGHTELPGSRSQGYAGAPEYLRAACRRHVPTWRRRAIDGELSCSVLALKLQLHLQRVNRGSYQ
jgi:hypothetical protein